MLIQLFILTSICRSLVLIFLAKILGTYYYFYEWTKDRFKNLSKTNRPISIFESMVASAIVAFTVIITNPVWVVNVCIQYTILKKLVVL